MSSLIDMRELRGEMSELEVEALGWQPLGEGAYLHVADGNSLVIDVVGVVSADMAGMDILWLT